MAWRLAKSIDTLRKQVNEQWPNRSKAADGTIGDAAHSSRASDHNPNAAGVVCAIDFTHDPKDGVSSEVLAEAIRATQDDRIGYIISNKKICSSVAVGGVPAWTWRKYSGSNPHNKHVHISVKQDKKLYDQTKKWDFVQHIRIPEAKKTLITARAVGIGGAGLTATAQVASVISGPVAQKVEEVKVVTDNVGQIVDVTKQVYTVAPSGFWENVLNFMTSPIFLAGMLLLVICAWGVSYYITQKRRAMEL